MLSLLLFAAKGNPEVEAIGSLLLFIACMVTLIWYGVHAATNEISVDTKRGVPYCRGCGRQVSYRRDHCRSCGLSLYVPRQPEQVASVEEALQREQWRKAQQRDAEEYAKMAERSTERQAERLAARAARRVERDDAYRARGIEPGP